MQTAPLILPSERRITLRILSYWEKLRGQRPMPSADEVHREDICDLWDYCFLIHIIGDNREGYGLAHMGRSLREIYSTDPLNASTPQAQRLMQQVNLLVKGSRPVLDEGEFAKENRQVVKYRQCLVPLGENGRIRAVLGAMRYKIY